MLVSLTYINILCCNIIKLAKSFTQVLDNIFNLHHTKIIIIKFICYRPRRNRQSSVEKALGNSQSCEQLDSSTSASTTNSPVKTLYSLPERLSESDNVDCKEVKMLEDGHICSTCKRPIDSCEHTQISLPTPLDVTTQTKRKKNFMDRCVNKVRLC